MPMSLAAMLAALAMTSAIVVLASPDHAQTSGATLKITTREAFPSGSALTHVLYVKGARRREDLMIRTPNAADARQTSIRLLDCDRRRALTLFPENRTYVEDRMEFDVPRRPPASRPVTDPSSPLGPVVSVTIETVDTGERRQVGSLIARRVVETRTTVAEPAARARSAVDVGDGWFVDVPRGCGGSGSTGRAVVMEGSLPGEPPVQWQITSRGAPEHGYPLDITRRHTSADLTTTTTSVLVELSEAPLEETVFELPAGYQPALPLPGGGYELTMPDTLLNRVDSYWRWFTTWVSRVTG